MGCNSSLLSLLLVFLDIEQLNSASPVSFFVSFIPFSKSAGNTLVCWTFDMSSLPFSLFSLCACVLNSFGLSLINRTRYGSLISLQRDADHHWELGPLQEKHKTWRNQEAKTRREHGGLKCRWREGLMGRDESKERTLFNSSVIKLKEDKLTFKLDK